MEFQRSSEKILKMCRFPTPTHLAVKKKKKEKEKWRVLSARIKRSKLDHI